MASSPASQGGHHRRRLNARRQPLSRTNTLFGAIKNIVTAPLSWFASTDDFEDTRDNSGKRRRLAPVQTEPTINEEDMAPRTKRMRVDSPSRELRREGAYLDPPQAVFEQPPSIGRSASMGIQVANAQLPAVGITGNYVRSTLTPLRNLSISRTMSIDPPRPQSRDGGVFQSQRPLGSNQDMDSSMESVLPLPPVFASSASSLPRTSLSMPRDMSRPHSRPPFRMRTSLTPQPAAIQRERSEPPPLHLLKAHPTFVKPPPLEEGSRVGSNEPDTTLGSLVDSARRTQSPARQQSSLLFGSKTQVEPKSDISRGQKALHELEIYKTPLLPTRLRNGATQSITGVPDLFRPRRKLVLMKDEGRADRTLGRKEAISPDKNGTKPYAGEGDMKRMLAKRKLELEEEGEERAEVSGKVEEAKGEKKDEGIQAEKVEALPSLPKEIPPPPKDDWYSLASGTSSGAGGSSLRVGRAKSSRNHISRPTARPKAKFSAAFDEEGDDAMVDEDKEREMIEEAAKKAPAFNIPAGFSFAKDVQPIQHDSADVKEPPVKSLPFSFTTPAAPVPRPEKTEAPAPAPSPSQPPPTTTLPLSFAPPPAATTQEKPASLFGSLPSLPSQPMEGPKGGIPNFFARSAAFNKPLEIKTPPLTFSPHPTELPEVEATPPALMPVPLPVFSLSTPSGNGTPSVSSGATSLFGSPAPSAPMKDAGNPFWDGEKKMETLKKDEPQAAPVSVFGAAAQENPAKEAKASGPASSLFGDANKTTTAPAPFSAQAVKPVETADTAKPPIFTFGAPASTTSLFGVKPNEGVPTSNEFPPSFFGTQKASGTTSTAFTPAGGSSITDSNKQPTSLFGATPKPKAEVGKPASATAPSTHATATTPFSYGQPAAPPNVEAPKPVVSNGSSLHFGNALPTETKIPSPIPFIFSSSSEKDATKPATPPALFPFGAPEKETKPTSPAPFSFTGPEETKATSPAPFTFVAPSTPVAAEKTAPFTYGTPSASPVPPSVFSFSAGGSTTGDVSKPLQLDRPVTPPKNGDQEFKMEESPTREVQQTNANSKPDFTGFNFGNPPSSGSVLFGGPTSAPPTTTPFPFSSNSPSNLFAAPPMKESKSEGPKPFTFGQSIAPTSATSTGFSFSQTTQNPESPRPSTGGSFGFGGGPSTPTTTASGFNFGATPASNPFGQQQSGGSAPSSPSTFQAGTFNFSSASSGTGFGFGSQPASPATGSTNLPPATTPFGGGNTGFNSSAPSSPFNAPGQIAPSTSSGGTLFTIGAAPPLQTGTQGRAIKKLPNRNRAKR